MNESMYQQMIAFYMHTPPHKLPAFPGPSDDVVSIGISIKNMIREGVIKSIRMNQQGLIEVLYP